MQRIYGPAVSAATQRRGVFFWALLIIGLNNARTAAAETIRRFRRFRVINASPPFAICVLCTWLLYAQPADPISDRMRFDLAVAQRDYLAAKQAYDQAAASLRAKFEQLNAVCVEQGASFDATAFACKKAEAKK